MRGRDILSGQAIDRVLALRARQLRHPMSAAEQVLWRSLHANRLGGFHFRRRQIVSGFIIDFYCHAARLVVEVDGGVHRSQSDADRERDAILTGLGLTVLRVANDEVIHGLDSVLDRIVAFLPTPPARRSAASPRNGGALSVPLAPAKMTPERRLRPLS